MPSQKRKIATAIVSLVAVLALATVATAADEKEVYTAFAVNMGGAAQGASGTIEINITRWSSAEERNMLLNTLKEKGHDEFMKALRK